MRMSRRGLMVRVAPRPRGNPFGLASIGAFACAAATLFVSREGATPQLGAANVPLPNAPILIMLDTSGSFELMIDGNTPETLGGRGRAPAADVPARHLECSRSRTAGAPPCRR